MATATGTFEVASWNEEPYEEWDGGKLTRASVGLKLAGDIDGAASVVWLMCYRSDGTAQFTGLLRVDGTVGRRAGSFVVEDRGAYDGTEASSRWAVVPGSGTGELAGITGEGRRAPSGSPEAFELDYELA